MKKNTSIVVVVIAVLVIVIGGFAIMHKPSKASPSSNASVHSTKPAVNNAVLSTKTDATLGQYLANPGGMPLYTYGSDTSGMSKCTGSCLSNWPAYQDTGSTTGLPSGVGTITRTDNGQKQYTYNGMPLYTFVGDSSGKATGNGVNGFSLAVPASASSSQPTTVTPSTSSTQSTGGSSSSNGYDY